MDNTQLDRDHWIQLAKNFWVSAGINLEKGAKEEEIAKTESIVEFAFPSDAKELYKEVNGFENFDWTPGMISIWPMERIRDE